MLLDSHAKEKGFQHLYLNKKSIHVYFTGKHCINNEKAVDRWRLIRPIPVKGQQATQFQCTWL